MATIRAALYKCPVCYYDKMRFPPTDWNICPCCGTEFNYDDFATSHEELRARWIAKDSLWFSDAKKDDR